MCHLLIEGRQGLAVEREQADRGDLHLVSADWEETGRRNGGRVDRDTDSRKQVESM